jgi:hypothetical protein
MKLVGDWNLQFEALRGSVSTTQALASEFLPHPVGKVNPHTGVSDTDYAIEAQADSLADGQQKVFYEIALSKASPVLSSPIAKKNIGFANKAIKSLREDLKEELEQPRKDAQKTVNSAFNLILANLVVCVLSKRRLSLSGSEKSYNKDEHLNSLFLTFRKG